MKRVCVCVTVLARQWSVCVRQSARVPLDESVFFFFFFPPALPGTVVTHVRRHSLSQLCLRWSEVRRQEEAPGGSAVISAVHGGGGGGAINNNTNKRLGSRYALHLPSSLLSLSLFLPGRVLTHTVIALQRSSDRSLKVRWEDELKIRAGNV